MMGPVFARIFLFFIVLVASSNSRRIRPPIRYPIPPRRPAGGINCQQIYEQFGKYWINPSQPNFGWNYGLNGCTTPAPPATAPPATTTASPETTTAPSETTTSLTANNTGGGSIVIPPEPYEENLSDVLPCILDSISGELNFLFPVKCRAQNRTT